MNKYDFLDKLRRIINSPNINDKEEFLLEQIKLSQKLGQDDVFLLSLYYVNQEKITPNDKDNYIEYILKKFDKIDPNCLGEVVFLKYLCCVEAIFDDELRGRIFDKFYSFINTNPLNYKLWFVPIIAEYLHGYQLKKSIHTSIKKNRFENYDSTQKLKSNNLPRKGISVHSSKGGVGKTFFSLLSSSLSNQESTIVDFDFHGASLQLSIEDERISNDFSKSDFHTYYRYLFENLRKDPKDFTPFDSSLYIYKLKLNENICSILQTGGYSLGAFLLKQTSHPSSIPVTLKMLTTLINEGKYLILDNQPGLYGFSMNIFAISNILDFQPIYIVNSKPDSFLPVLYELPWNIMETSCTPIVIFNKNKGFSLNEYFKKVQNNDVGDIKNNIFKFNDYLMAFDLMIPKVINNNPGYGYLYLGNNKKALYFNLPYDEELEDSEILNIKLLQVYIKKNFKIINNLMSLMNNN
jgi:hypothetical protein